MRSTLLALTLAASALLPAAAGASITTECLPSLQAARAAHPIEHLAWSGRCYFKGHRGDRSIGKRNSTRATARPDEDMRRVTAVGDGQSGRPGGAERSATGTNSQIGAQLRQGGHATRPARDTQRIHQEAGGPTRPSSASASLAPPPPVQIADLVPNQPLREAMESYVAGKYWVLMWRMRN